MMRRISLLLVGLTVLSSLVSADSLTTDAIQDEPSKVLTLTDETFDEALTAHPLLLVKFYTPWCGYCKALAPEYEGAAEQISESPFNNTILAQVDCSVYEDLCMDNDITSFPTLKMYRGGIPTIYDGARQTTALTRYVERQSMPAVTLVNDLGQLETLIRSDPVVVVGGGDETFHSLFQTLAEELRDRYLFGWRTFDDDGGLVLYTGMDATRDTYTGQLNDTESIKTFIRQHLTPLFGPIGPDTYLEYEEAQLPLAYLFVNSEATLQAFTDPILALAQQYRGRINFCYIDADAYPEQAEYLGINMTEPTWPAFVIQDPQSRRFILNQDAVTPAAITDHLDQYLQNKLVAYIESDPVPASNQGPVKVVVGLQYNELVTSSDQDVLIKVYAPWCGHCKALAPIWTRLGELVRDEQAPLRVAKMDGSSNDIPMDDPAVFDVDSFPTIAYIHAGTHRVELYQGEDRSMSGLVDFIHQQSGIRLTLSDHDTLVAGQDEGTADEGTDSSFTHSQIHDEL